MNTDTTKVTEQASDGCSGIPEGSYPPGYSRRDIQEQGVTLEDDVRLSVDPYRGQQQYLPYQFRLAWLRNTYPQGIIRQLEPEMLAEGRQLIGGMEFFRNPEDTIGERVYCQVSRDETGPELDTRDLFEVLRQKLINALTIGLGFSLPVLSTRELQDQQKQREEKGTEEDPRLKLEVLQDELVSLHSQLEFAREVKAKQDLEIRDLHYALNRLEHQQENRQKAVLKLNRSESAIQTAADEYRPDQVAFVRKAADGSLRWVNQEGGRISTPVLNSVEEAWDAQIPLKKGVMISVRERLEQAADSEDGPLLLRTWLNRTQKISSKAQFPGICAVRYLYYHGELNELCRKLGLDPWPVPDSAA